MKTRNKHIWLSSLLTAILLFQWGYGAIHVFTSHTEFHFQNKVDNSNEAVYGVDYECDLCAKLNTKPITFFFTPKIAIAIAVFLFLFGLIELRLSAFKFYSNTQRGPPLVH